MQSDASEVIILRRLVLDMITRLGAFCPSEHALEGPVHDASFLSELFSSRTWGRPFRVRVASRMRWRLGVLRVSNVISVELAAGQFCFASVTSFIDVLRESVGQVPECYVAVDLLCPGTGGVLVPGGGTATLEARSIAAKHVAVNSGGGIRVLNPRV
eukprot:311000-Pyramimonas_sp.AAC.1